VTERPLLDTLTALLQTASELTSAVDRLDLRIGELITLLASIERKHGEG
jgi:hypothetical protein